MTFAHVPPGGATLAEQGEGSWPPRQGRASLSVQVRTTSAVTPRMLGRRWHASRLRLDGVRA